MKSLDEASLAGKPNRVCVIFPGALGDFICLLPALGTLLWNAEIDLFARSEFADVAPPGVAVHSMEAAEIRSLFVDDSLSASALESFFGAFAAVYSWMGSHEPGFVKRLKTFSHYRAQVFPFRPTAAVEHQADYYLRCLGRTERRGAMAAIKLSAEAVAWREGFWREHSLQRRAVLTIAPGSGAREKNWPEDHFLDIVRWWSEHTGGAVVLLVGPVEAEKGGIDRLQAKCLVARDLRLAQVAAVLARSALYLGNDSGISHLAAAVGAATIALFGPSDPLQWAPRGERVTVLRGQIDCAPCAPGAMKTCPHRACLTQFYPQNLIARMSRLPEVAILTRWGAGITV
ncbi:MAG: glycosyltransferase family 9 protein [Candidatus Binatia bacterium]